MLGLERAARAALSYFYVMENGRIVGEGKGKTQEANQTIRETYLGL